MSYEVRVPLCNSINCHAAPIMASDYDSRDGELEAYSSHGVRVRFEGEVGEGGRCSGFAIAHAVQSNASKAEREKSWDLVAPGK